MNINNGIMSYGIILLDSHNKIILVQRRNSVEYIEIIRGNYKNLELLCHLCSLITLEEKKRILNFDFKTNWDKMNNKSKIYEKYYKQAHEKFIENNVVFIVYDLPNTSLYSETEFCIPKGRKKRKDEKEKTCAIREFREETGIKKEIFITNTIFMEHFYGTNGKKYSTKYFLAKCKQHDQNYTFTDNEIQCVLSVNVFELSKYARFYRNNLLDIFFKMNEFINSKK
jgi:ADP-ribose pyrophosphatase YjhB (NUDIX family)